MENIIAIYGKTCTLKTEVAQEISQITGFKLANRGEKATTEAKVTKAATAALLSEKVHRELDKETLAMAERNEKLMIFESAFMDSVLKGKANVFLVHLRAQDEVRNKRWQQRKEEAGGRTRQLGESVAARDNEDLELRKTLYGSAERGGEPAPHIQNGQRLAGGRGEPRPRHRYEPAQRGRGGPANLGNLRGEIRHSGAHQQARHGQGRGAGNFAGWHHRQGEALHGEAASVRWLHHRRSQRQGHLRPQVRAGRERLGRAHGGPGCRLRYRGGQLWRIQGGKGTGSSLIRPSLTLVWPAGYVTITR